MSYILPKEERESMVAELVELLPAEGREEAKKKVMELSDLFEGQDLNTLGVLGRAAEKGRFDEYEQKLREYHQEKGQYVSPSDRKLICETQIPEPILRMMAQKEDEIAMGTRPVEDRDRHPRKIAALMPKRGAVKMEIFFLDCYKEIMG
jgi:hypothetical protein